MNMFLYQTTLPLTRDASALPWASPTSRAEAPEMATKGKGAPGAGSLFAILRKRHVSERHVPLYSRSED